MTKKVLDREGIYYTAVNVEDDATAYHYVTETLNRREMPVVIASTPEEDVIWSGFQPAMIREHITHRADAA
jgi:glutaredoxin-like protein NrdH